MADNKQIHTHTLVRRDDATATVYNNNLLKWESPISLPQSFTTLASSKTLWCVESLRRPSGLRQNRWVVADWCPTPHPPAPTGGVKLRHHADHDHLANSPSPLQKPQKPAIVPQIFSVPPTQRPRQSVCSQ